jgi:hypothetical protein
MRDKIQEFIALSLKQFPVLFAPAESDESPCALFLLVLPFLLTTHTISLNCSAHHRLKPVLGVLDLRAEKKPLST